jgi:hypothetical protein
MRYLHTLDPNDLEQEIERMLLEQMQNEQEQSTN